jgi:copper chaperone CopZ
MSQRGQQPRGIDGTVHQIRLAVSGMTCRSCVRGITARLRDVPGVHTVLADRATGVVVLSGIMTEAEVLAVFEGSSHQAVVLPECRCPACS